MAGPRSIPGSLRSIAFGDSRPALQKTAVAGHRARDLYRARYSACDSWKRYDRSRVRPDTTGQRTTQRAMAVLGWRGLARVQVDQARLLRKRIRECGQHSGSYTKRSLSARDRLRSELKAKRQWDRGVLDSWLIDRTSYSRSRPRAAACRPHPTRQRHIEPAQGHA